MIGIESTAFTQVQAILSMKEPLSCAMLMGVKKRPPDKARGERFRYLRKEVLGLSQEALAKELGVERGSVGNWELGGGIDPENLKKIRRRWRISTEWVEDGVGEKPVPGDIVPGRVYVPEPEEHAELTLADSAYSREHYAPKVDGALPELDVSLGAGEGRVGETLAVQISSESYSGHRVIAEWVLPEPFIRTEAKASVGSTVVFPVTGDSMFPSYNVGDRVLVDLSQNTFIQDAVYAISDGHSEPRIKRLQHIFNSMPRRVRIISDNPAYAPEEHLLSDVTIVGRVCGVIARR